MEFVLIKKIYVEVDLAGTHPGLIEKQAFVNASFSDLNASNNLDDLQILRKDAMNLAYRYRLDQHTHIRVIEELVDVVN